VSAARDTLTMGGLFSYPLLPNLLPLQKIESLVPDSWNIDPISSLLHQAQLHLTFLSVRVVYQARLTKAYDNVNPRAQIAKYLTLDTRFAQLHGAYMNGMEFFPLYTAAVLSCVAVDMDTDRLKRMCTTAVLLRVVYYFLYSVQHTKGGAALRSLSWIMSLAHTCQMLRSAANEYNENTL
jgi:uncharacterized MAPEG superfamily protein